MKWINRHHYLLGALALVIAVVGLILTFTLHSQDDSRINADRAATQASNRARQEAAKTTDSALHAAICPLVWTYENLGRSSPNGPQVATGWHAIGALLGCPDGTKPAN